MATFEVQSEGDLKYIEVEGVKIPLDREGVKIPLDRAATCAITHTCTGVCAKNKGVADPPYEKGGVVVCRCLDEVELPAKKNGGNPFRELLFLAWQNGSDKITLDLDDIQREELMTQARDVARDIAAWRALEVKRALEAVAAPTLVKDQVSDAKDLETKILKAGLDVTKKP